MAPRLANVSIKQLRAFVALAGQSSFTRAAQTLHLTQSALSALIRGLEGEIGLKLFDRTTRRSELTEAGRELLPTAERLLSDLDAAVMDLRRLADRKRGRVRIATSPLLAATMLPPLLATFRAAQPGIDVVLQDVAIEQITQRVRSGEADLGVGTADHAHPDLHEEGLFEDALVLAVPASHAWAARRTLAWSALAGVPLLALARGSGVRTLLERTFAAMGTEPVVAFEVGQVSTVIGLVEAGLGPAVLPAYAVRAARARGVVMVKLVAPAVLRQVSVWTSRQRSLVPAAQALLDHLRSGLRKKSSRVSSTTSA